jgi:hypothetical protein
MRHTFVSVLSANGVPVESIALLPGMTGLLLRNWSTAMRSGVR